MVGWHQQLNGRGFGCLHKCFLFVDILFFKTRPGYWSGQPFPSPGDLPNPGVEPGSSALQVDCLPSESPGMYYLLSKFYHQPGTLVGAHRYEFVILRKHS